MQKYCPAYPQPVKNAWTRWWRLLNGQSSLIDALTPKSYRMQMGHGVHGGQHLYTVNDPKAVRQMLIHEHANFPKHSYMDTLLKPLLGESIFTSNGTLWQRRRQMMEPAFEQTRMDLAFPAMVDAAQSLLARMREHTTGSLCPVEEHMTHFTADVIFRTIFSVPLSIQDAQAIFRAFAVFQSVAPKSAMLVYKPAWVGKLVGTRYATQTQAAAKTIRDLLRQQVLPRYVAYQAQPDVPAQDILGALLQARDPDTQLGLSVEELVNEIAVLFLAGHETSASALSWALHLLAQSPDVQERVAQEAQTAMPQPTPSLEQLGRLDLTRRVFKETLRLYPPLGFLIRQAEEPSCLRDHQVPPGATMLVSPWLIHRHRSYWQEPDVFDPDRYLRPEGKASAATAFLPFSLGPRVCVGAGFALQEAALALSMLMREFRFEPAPGRQPLPIAKLTLRSDIGVSLHIQHRHRSADLPNVHHD